MPSLDEQLARNEEEREGILKKIEVRNANRKIECRACDDSHRIKDLTAIQTHDYHEPWGCTGGDYWSQGELQFVCPETGVVNRLLFFNSDVPYQDRKKFKNDPEAQFKDMYKHLFKEVVQVHESRSFSIMDGNLEQRPLNNYYVDNNRKKFGLVKKKK